MYGVPLKIWTCLRTISQMGGLNDDLMQKMSILTVILKKATEPDKKNILWQT